MAADWQREPLGHHADIRARIGWRGLSSSEYVDQGPYLIAGQHIKHGRVCWNLCDHISDRRYQESWEIALRPGDLILSKDGTIGRVARLDSLPGPATINGTMMLIRPKGMLESSYLFHALEGASFQKLVADKVSGSTVPHIFQRDMETLMVAVPAPPEQRAIASVLDSLDDGIRVTHAILHKLIEVREGVLGDLVSKGVDVKGRVRNPDEEPASFKQTEVGLIPRSWDVGPLQAYGSRDRPYVKTGPFGSSLNQAHWVDEGVPVLTIGALGEGAVKANELLFVSDETAKVLDAFSLQHGDVVFSRVADVGRSLTIRPAQSGWLMSSNLMRLSVDPDVAIPDWLQINLAANPVVRDQIRRLVNVGGRDVANSTVINRLLFPWPPRDEQEQIVSVLDGIGMRINAEKASLEKLRYLKAGVAHDLLSGQVGTVGVVPENAA